MPLAGLLVIAALPARAGCPADAATVRTDAAEALAAYSRFEIDQFETLLDRLDADLSCLTEVLPRDDAADVHFAHALGGFLDKDDPATLAACRGVLATRPGFDPDPAFAPEGGRLREIFVEAEAQGGGESVPLVEGWLIVDGESGARSVPSERCAIVQQLDPAGEVHTWYIEGTGIPADLPGMTASPEPAATRHRSRNQAIAGGVTLGIGGLSLLLASRAEDAFWEEPVESEAERIYKVNRLLGFGGWTLSIAGTGMVVGAAVRGEW